MCQSVLHICATNKELNLISKLVLCLFLKITTCLLVLFNQSRDSTSELFSSLSAYKVAVFTKAGAFEYCEEEELCVA